LPKMQNLSLPVLPRRHHVQNPVLPCEVSYVHRKALESTRRKRTARTHGQRTTKKENRLIKFSSACIYSLSFDNFSNQIHNCNLRLFKLTFKPITASIVLPAPASYSLSEVYTEKAFPSRLFGACSTDNTFHSKQSKEYSRTRFPRD
jgi:hypothetical protein